MIIRPYEQTDTAQLVSIWRAASEQAHSFFAKEQLDHNERLVRDIYLPKAENWVLSVENDPVGFIGLIDHFIGGLFVAPLRHGHGYGRALVDHAAQLKGRLELEVYSRNQSAVRFYQRLGFVEISRRPTDDHGLPFELIKMQRDG